MKGNLLAEIRAHYYSQYISVRELGRIYGIPHSTVWRAVSEAY